MKRSAKKNQLKKIRQFIKRKKKEEKAFWTAHMAEMNRTNNTSRR